ncbi:hypothetical protein BKA81DRAFT_380106 [Phyllosticta paracitricarpa]|uniref:Uncharacterized protein n=1 Tax=Phyllosticta citricarpa TaxID=55181 RepID=A0ABR1LYP1_9PEZI
MTPANSAPTQLRRSLHECQYGPLVNNVEVRRLSTSAPALAPVHVLALAVVAATTTVLSAVICEARRDGGRRWTMGWELPELWSVAVGSATTPNARQICDVAA